MAHYAFINSDNIVVEVITGKDESETAPEGFDNWEAYYENKREGLTCKRTSYNTLHNTHLFDGTPFRGNYAGMQMIYDSENDIFLEPKPFDSWVVDTDNAVWKAPTDKPNDDNIYYWDESNTQWVIRPDVPTEEGTWVWSHAGMQWIDIS